MNDKMENLNDVNDIRYLICIFFDKVYHLTLYLCYRHVVFVNLAQGKVTLF